jgi:hypothetical protein
MEQSITASKILSVALREIIPSYSDTIHVQQSEVGGQAEKADH